jgi:quercetin dioxygenase-like cupin family protein
MHATTYGDLATLMTITADSTISRTIHQDSQVKAVLFGFAAGQELSEHTSATPAILHFISGTALVTLGDEQIEAQPNTWVHMPARLPHSIAARTLCVMLLLMLKNAA